jgi:hypothetical protein
MSTVCASSCTVCAPTPSIGLCTLALFLGIAAVSIIISTIVIVIIISTTVIVIIISIIVIVIIISTIAIIAIIIIISAIVTPKASDAPSVCCDARGEDQDGASDAIIFANACSSPAPIRFACCWPPD